MEFLQKHFDLAVDRTRVDDDPGRIVVVLRHTPTDSLLEIEAAGNAAAFRFAGAAWTVAGGKDPDALREALLIEALGMLRGRIVAVTAWAGNAALGRAAGRDASAAAAALAVAHPGADRLTVKAWGSPESVLPPVPPSV